MILYFLNPIVLTIAKISKLIFLVQWIVMWIAKIASIAHFLKQKDNMSIGVFFFADISKAVTLNLEIKGIIKRWSKAESFSIFENYD